MIARLGTFSLRRDWAVALAIAVIILGAGASAINDARATSIACMMMLIIGLPHGALDMAMLRRGAAITQLLKVAGYVAAATAMFAVWRAAPVAGLAIFYAISTLHFAQDWEEACDPFLAYALALAMLSAPALSHGSALKDVFVILTADARAALIVDVLVLAAPIAIAVALVGLVTMRLARRRVEGLCTLGAMLLLPPVMGFAVFFCLFHSPRHFREGWATLRPERPRSTALWVAATTVAGLGVAAVIYVALETPDVPATVFKTSMMTLSVLTVPHMLLAIMQHDWGERIDMEGDRLRRPYR